MKPIIEVKNVSKQYTIGTKQRYLSLRDSISDFFRLQGRNTERSINWAIVGGQFTVSLFLLIIGVYFFRKQRLILRI